MSLRKEAAQRSADRIKAYWAKRGYTVRADIQNAGLDGRKEPIWEVRTSLIDGLPPKFKRDDVQKLAG